MALLKGFIIGKFMPPHNGHLHLFDYALKYVSHLTVMIFWKRGEPIPGPQRLEWLKQLRPNIHFVECSDEHPVDYNDSAIWDLWMGSIRKSYSDSPDFVFASEDYGAELARRLNAKFICVDKARSFVPVSASKIRNEPWLNWEYIPDIVKPYFVQRVCLVGGESTGKTTLAQALAKHFNTVCVLEYAREFLLANANLCRPEDLLHIADEQIKREDTAQRSSFKFLFCDTNAIITKIWSLYYFMNCSAHIENLIRNRSYSLYLLTCPDIPWVSDGLRDTPANRGWFYEQTKAELNSIGANYLEVRGSGDCRVQCAVQQVREFFRL